MAEQADLRQDVRGVRTLVRQSQLESQAHAKVIKLVLKIYFRLKKLQPIL